MTIKNRISKLEAKRAPRPAALPWLVPWRHDETAADAERRFASKYGRLPNYYLLAPIPLSEAEWIARYSPD